MTRSTRSRNVAGLTGRLLLGTSAVLALLHPPVALARRLATLDQLSGGRVIAGLGQGWMPEEFVVSGVPMRRRGAGMVEHVPAMRATWGPDPVSFSGRFYQIPTSDIGPKPAQPNGIPILLAYDSEAGIRRAAQIADGLLPNVDDLATLIRHIGLFREAARMHGRDPDSLSVLARFRTRFAPMPMDAADRPLFSGTVDQWCEDVERVERAGVFHALFGSREPIELQIERLSELRARTS